MADVLPTTRPGIDHPTTHQTGVAVSADRVVTLVLPKTSLRGIDGDLFCVDLGIPDAVFHEAGLDYDRLFGTEPSVRLNLR